MLWVIFILSTMGQRTWNLEKTSLIFIAHCFGGHVQLLCQLGKGRGKQTDELPPLSWLQDVSRNLPPPTSIAWPHQNLCPAWFCRMCHLSRQAMGRSFIFWDRSQMAAVISLIRHMVQAQWQSPGTTGHRALHVRRALPSGLLPSLLCWVIGLASPGYSQTERCKEKSRTVLSLLEWMLLNWR